MKVAFVHSISFVYEKDGEEMQVMKQTFRLGEALITKKPGCSEVLTLKDKYQYELIRNFCIAIDYDAMRDYGSPLSLCLIGFCSNPGGLMIRINGVPMRNINYQDFPSGESYEDSELTEEDIEEGIRCSNL